MIVISRPALPDHTELDVVPAEVRRGDVVQFLVRGTGGGSRQGGRVVRVSPSTIDGRPGIRFDFEDDGDYYTATSTSVLRIERPQNEGALSARREVVVTEVAS